MNWKNIQHVLILQPENPDADSVASALALEEILGDAQITTTIYSYVNIPSYLGYIHGHDRITDDFPQRFDLTIIVDTVTASLLENTLTGPRLTAINQKPVLVLDHHPTTSDLPLPGATYYAGGQSCVSTGQIVYKLALEQGWNINQIAATHIVESMLADTLGLTTEPVGAEAFTDIASLIELGVSMSEIDTRRRAHMKKSPELVTYKGKLLQRIEYLLEGTLAWIVIPWEEIQRYSPLYNPSMLALEELRNTEGVEISVAIKSYPDGKITGKIRANLPIANDLAAHFGGGGHDYAAGFKTMSWKLDELKPELVSAVSGLLDSQHDRA